MNYWKILFSPFKPFKLKWYTGKTAVGVPYFYPRKWIKATPELAHKAVLEYIKSEENYNKLNPNHARKIRPYDEVYQDKMGYQYAVPLKVGFSYCGLGWKTKWTDTDYRFEWTPRISFVFFGYQIAATVVVPDPHQYWEAWLYYERNTDKSASNLSRILECMEKYPMNWIKYDGDKEIKINYYTKVLKKKYLKFIK